MTIVHKNVSLLAVQEGGCHEELQGSGELVDLGGGVSVLAEDWRFLYYASFWASYNSRGILIFMKF